MSRYSRRQKKRLEKRRRTRRSTKVEKVEKVERSEKVQHGGQQDIRNIDDWILAVNKSPAFVAQEDLFIKDPSKPETSLGRYTLANLKDDALTLPDRLKNPDTGFYVDMDDNNFKLSNGADIRSEAVTLRMVFDDLINQNPTAYAFMNHIIGLKGDPKTDSSIHQTIYLAEQLEYELKTKGGVTDLDESKMLTDPKNYPLYLLTLLVNTTIPAEKDQSPLLVSVETTETSSTETL